MKLKKIFYWLDPFTYLDLFLEKIFGKPKNTLIKTIYWIFYILFSFILAYLIYSILGMILRVSMPLAIVVSTSMTPTLNKGDVVILTAPENLNVPIITINDNIKEKDLFEIFSLEYEKNEFGLEEIKSISTNDINLYVSDAIKNNNSIIVYKSNTTPKDIIHRAIVYIKANDGEYIITKGDNSKTNRYIDQDCGIDRNISSSTEIYVSKGCLHLYPTPVESIIGKKIGKIPYIGYIKLIFTS